jgi:hypothetical protein
MREHQRFSQQSEEPPIQDEILLLEEYYDAFNEIFFFTALRHNCSGFEMVRAGTDEWKEQKSKTKLAYTIGNWPYVSSRHKVQASIHILEIVESETHTQRMKNYIESLLHEMIDAIILIYTCPCADCGNKYKFDLRETGHGRIWQAIAHAVENFCFNKLGLEFDLGRALGLASEINAAYTEILATYELDCPLVFEHVGKLGGWIKSEGGRGTSLRLERLER